MKGEKGGFKEILVGVTIEKVYHVSQVTVTALPPFDSVAEEQLIHEVRSDSNNSASTSKPFTVPNRWVVLSWKSKKATPSHDEDDEMNLNEMMFPAAGKPLKKAAIATADPLAIELETSLVEDVMPLKKKTSTRLQKKKASKGAAEQPVSKKAKVGSKGADEDPIEAEPVTIIPDILDRRITTTDSMIDQAEVAMGVIQSALPKKDVLKLGMASDMSIFMGAFHDSLLVINFFPLSLVLYLIPLASHSNIHLNL